MNNTKLAYWRRRDHTEQAQAMPAEVVLDPPACQILDRRMGPFKTIQPQMLHVQSAQTSQPIES